VIFVSYRAKDSRVGVLSTERIIWRPCPSECMFHPLNYIQDFYKTWYRVFIY